MTTTTAFPFSVGPAGAVRGSDGNEALRGRILQVLFTAPGERVGLPEFGCGLFNLVFESGDELLQAATSFSVVQALSRWLGDEIVVEGVDVTARDGTVVVEVAYRKRVDLSREGVRIQFHEGSAWTTG